MVLCTSGEFNGAKIWNVSVILLTVINTMRNLERDF